MGNFQDLTGRRFGRLTVIERCEDYVSPKGHHRIRWLCKCDCGGYAKPTSGSLLQGKSRSCGCLTVENSIVATKKSNTKKNRYDLTGNYGIGYTSKNEAFYFDLEDYDKIKDYCWLKSHNGYIKSHKDKWYCMHRLVMNVEDKGVFVDHIHGEHTRNDNRKQNLRIVTKSQNNMNKKMQRNNTSGIVGVYQDKKRNKWVAEITVNCKKIYLGRYNTKKEAAKVRKDAEEKYFGEYSYENSQRYVSGDD